MQRRVDLFARMIYKRGIPTSRLYDCYQCFRDRHIVSNVRLLDAGFALTGSDTSEFRTSIKTLMQCYVVPMLP